MKTNKIIFLCLFLITIFLTTNCEEPGNLNEIYLYPKNLWGEWIRIDNGHLWYIASNYIKSDDYNEYISYTFNKQSANVIQVTENSAQTKFYLYASRVPNSSFKASVVMDDNISSNSFKINSRAVKAPGGMIAKIPNVNNSGNSPVAVTDNDGNLEVEGIIAGDEYDVIIGNDTVRIQPNTDGDDVGTITLINGNGLSFKASIVPATSDNEMMGLYSNREYKFNIWITNTGSIQSKYSAYTLSSTIGLDIESEKTGTIGTINPGMTFKIPITVFCDPLIKEYEYKKIEIKIIDNSEQDLTWNDSVSLKFNNDIIFIGMKAMGPLGDNRTIHGIIIVPGGKAYHFSASRNETQNLELFPVPKYSEEDYLIAFSCAETWNETAFSFKINNTIPPILNNIPSDFFLTPDHIYTAHNTENNAKQIKPDEQITSFIGAGDIIYFKVRF
ncbi:MAG: hypothetical protein FWB86_06320 [Treponema sp.]|nr:hypothetical protein [Treponema sp.]MCL2251862.1 hypothetical protein [Treponema sp.]